MRERTHVALPAGGHIARGRRCGVSVKDELPYPGRAVSRARGLGAPCRFTRSSPQSSSRGRGAPAHIPHVLELVVVVVVAAVTVAASETHVASDRSVAAEPGTRPSRSPVVADQSPRAPAHRQGHGARPARRGSTALRTLSRPANGGPKHARTHTDTTPDTTERSRSGRHSTDVEEQQQPETRDEKNIWFGVYATRPAMAPGRTSRRRHRLRRRASRD